MHAPCQITSPNCCMYQNVTIKIHSPPHLDYGWPYSCVIKRYKAKGKHLESHLIKREESRPTKLEVIRQKCVEFNFNKHVMITSGSTKEHIRKANIALKQKKL